MASFAEHMLGGLAMGGIYALLALAIVLVHRASGVVNVAQGEMATLSAFLCWTLVDHGWAFWPAFAATIALSFGGGLVLATTVVRPLQHGPALGAALLMVGLLLAVNGLDAWIWGGAPRRLDGPFSAAHVHVGGAAFAKRDLGVIVVAAAGFAIVALLLTRTKLGLGLRAAAASPLEARLSGVPAVAMVAVAWGLAAAVGAVAGVLAAPSLRLSPEMLQTVVLYPLAAAVVGGLQSPAGAVTGGLGLGVGIELLGAYVHWIDGRLRLAAALALLLTVLLVRPSGLLTRGIGRSA